MGLSRERPDASGALRAPTQAAASYTLLQAAAERKAEAKRSNVRQRASVWGRVRAAIVRPA